MGRAGCSRYLSGVQILLPPANTCRTYSGACDINQISQGRHAAGILPGHGVSNNGCLLKIGPFVGLDIVRRFMGRVITDNWDARWIGTIDFEIESSRFALLSRAYGFERV